MAIPSQPGGLAWQLLTDRQVYAARAEAQKAVLDLLGECADHLEKALPLNHWLPPEAIASSPRISRGENYKGLPWMVLDYPRVFEKESVAAFRTLVRFGDAVHCTFHLSGRFLEEYRKCSLENPDRLRKSKLMICIHQDPWLQHISADSFVDPVQISPDEIKEMKFFKPGATLALSEWETLPAKVTDVFTRSSLILKR